MTSRLSQHPFAVEAFFKYSLVLAYACDKDLLAKRLPLHLEVDTYEDRLGFIAAAFVDTRNLRPKGFPEWLGRDFILAGYRIFVRYRNAQGRRLRGLYILRSETNKLQMKILGNLFTTYHYHYVPLSFEASEKALRVTSPNGLDAVVLLPKSDEALALPATSPFPSWKEARRYSGPLPFTFSFHSARSEMVIVQGVRKEWDPKPVTVIQASIPALAQLGFEHASLASAFLVSDTNYYWKAGAIERPPFEKGTFHEKPSNA